MFKWLHYKFFFQVSETKIKSSKLLNNIKHWYVFLPSPNSQYISNQNEITITTRVEFASEI